MSDLAALTNEELLAELKKRLVPTGAALAEQFSVMYDDQQALFFEELSKLFESWENTGYSQQLSIAGHMVKCECITAAGRRWVHELAEALKYQEDRAAKLAEHEGGTG